MKHSEYVEIIKGQSKIILKTVLLRTLLRELPFLALGPMGFLTEKFVIFIASKMADETEMRVFYAYIDLRTDAQAKDFESAMIRNHTIQQIGTEDEKRIAEKDVEDTLNRLVSLRR